MGPQNPTATFGKFVTNGSLLEHPDGNLDIFGPALHVLDVETSLLAAGLQNIAQFALQSYIDVTLGQIKTTGRRRRWLYYFLRSVALCW
jgi:hypothetical protein